MRLKLYEDAIKAKAQKKKKKGRRNSRRSPTPQDEPTNADVEAEPPGEGTGGGDLASLAAAMSRESPSVIEGFEVSLLGVALRLDCLVTDVDALRDLLRLSVEGLGGAATSLERRSGVNS